MKLFHSHGHLIGGTLLIAATTIGVGMLALPIVTGPSGFAPSMLVYFICWALMLSTGLLILEVCSWMPPDSNLITMTTRLLGRPGEILCWLIYLFLFETLLIAHVVGGGGITREIITENLGTIPAMLIYVILFSPVVYLGTRIVDRLNLFMFSGLILTYLLFIIFSVTHVDLSRLSFMNWKKIWFAVPVIFTAFSYQAIIPTLVTYLKRDFKKTRKAIIFGTCIPLIVYVIWEVLILGIIPIEGPNGLLESAKKGGNAILPLKYFLGNPIMIGIGRAFGFFALTTSYIALSLAFTDFLADGLHVKKVGFRKLVLCLLVFVPPLIISMINPHIFLTALGYAGGICCAILFGLFPALMVWIGRYRKRYKTGEQMPGGKAFLSLVIVLIVIELCIEIIPHFTKS